MLHKTALQRYDKLRMVFARLMERFNGDDLDDFILTAHSLRQWIERDDTLTVDQKSALKRFVVDESLDWQICRQIANHQKHGGSWDFMSIVKTVQVKPGGQGFAVPPSMRVVGAGEEIVIEYDGNRDSALAFAIRTFRHFHYIFEVAPIPPSERAAPDLAELLLRRNPVVS
jgi:hypothetical protein